MTPRIREKGPVIRQGIIEEYSIGFQLLPTVISISLKLFEIYQFFRSVGSVWKINPITPRPSQIKKIIYSVIKIPLEKVSKKVNI